MSVIKEITVSDFINTKYRSYWDYSNKNGKNSVNPKEQLPEVIRKIIYAAYILKIKERQERKTLELIGEVAKYHPHGNTSIEDSIKGVATAYKSQPAVRLLEGIGNFGSAPGDEGAAGRYTSVAGTPLLSAIYRDIPFVPFNTDDTGLEQPEYISAPLPIALISGISSIGTGKSCYIAERDAKQIIEWIDKLRMENWSDKIPAPDPMSVTGCKTWYNPDNDYIYYDAVVHYGVDIHDITKRGKYDIITVLPPKSTPQNVILKLQQKMPSRITNKIINGSGRDNPIYIILPKGYLDEEDFYKYNLRYARKEQIYIWDDNINTMRRSNLIEIAKGWFEDRCKIVTKRLQKDIKSFEEQNHKFDLIKIYAEKGMTNWKSEDIIAYYKNILPETGEEDAQLVLSQPARAFLPENLDKNELQRQANNKNIKDLKHKINNIGDFIIQEAYEIIDKQEAFFSENY